MTVSYNEMRTKQIDRDTTKADVCRALIYCSSAAAQIGRRPQHILVTMQFCMRKIL